MNSRQFAIVAVITFIVGMVWLISDIIFNTKASIQISDKLQATLEPVNPTFNQRVVDIIQKETLSRDAIVVSSPLPTPLPEVTETEPSPLPSSAGTIPSPSPNPSISPVNEDEGSIIPIITQSPTPSPSPNPEENGGGL